MPTTTALARTLRPAATRTLVTGVLAVSAFAVPSAAPAHATTTARPVVVQAGTVLRPLPPRFELPVHDYRLTGRFGDVSGLWSSRHTGLDFAASTGTRIVSVSAGRVVSVGYDGRYGTKTVVRMGDGTELWYCHQDSTVVRPGQRVRPGQLLGYVGSSGNVTGPHLHLEVRPRPEDPVDPYAWLLSHGVHP